MTDRPHTYGDVYFRNGGKPHWFDWTSYEDFLGRYATTYGEGQFFFLVG